jgi:16S rRNA processing protein RimM
MTIKLQAKRKFEPENMISVGEITGAHGIKGQVKVESLTDFPEVRFAPGAEVYLAKQRRNVKVITSSVHKGLYLLQLEGVSDRDAAQSLLHTYLQVPKTELPELPEGEYYHFQLIGLTVYENGEEIGEITEIMQTGANDVYVIKTKTGYKVPEILLPALKTCIEKVDIAAGRMDVKIPEGLLD